ncbi:stalk domain-containing protein [Paenibacillus agilis]|uniref:VWA domain-containing protein n=1 Tax=Paenibacillus agilis TaxID=3020863 RepID=A0A559IK84_9BACL|nr:stalk domain-containing protein [Paenibacillus agilis]TVX88069.1 VWA domain-containing protein [Paenibacillus agilis]
MKCNRVSLLFLVMVMFVGSLATWTRTTNAYSALEYRKHDNLVHILADGDGQNRVFTFKTKNKITASNANLRLFINAQEIDPTEYMVDYNNYMITLNKAPDIGAELHFTYEINPSFEWSERLSGVSHIGHALSPGDGTTRVFKLHTNYKLNSSKKVSLYINNQKVPSTEFIFNQEELTITIKEKRTAPFAGTKLYFYFPESSVIGTHYPSGGNIEKPSYGGVTEQTTSGGTGVNTPNEEGEKNPSNGGKAEHPSSSGVINQPNSNEAGVNLPSREAEVNPPSEGGTETSVPSSGSGSIGTEVGQPFLLISGKGYPGSIKINKNNTFTVNISIQAKQPTYTSYLIVKNVREEVVRRIRVEAGASSSISISKLGLPTGGYYIYLKTINQSGGFAVSSPVFIPVNTEAKQINVFIEGHLQAYKQAPVSVNGNVLVPFRSIFESLGAKVKWNSNLRMITASREGTTIVLNLGSNVAYINGTAITMSTAPKLVNGVTMVPVRFVSEALGGKVEWNVAANSVIVFQNEPSISTIVESEKSAVSEGSSSSAILGKISKHITTSTDIIFVIDVTGSMGGVIDHIKETVKNFVDSVPNGSNFAIVAYRDTNIFDPNYKELEFYSFTNNKHVLKSNLEKLEAAGGADVPESGLEAIHMAAEKLSVSKNAKRIIFVTDATVHEKNKSPEKSSHTIDQISSKLSENKIIFDAIAPNSGSAYEQIIRLVNNNKGTLYDIDEASTLMLNK